MKRLFAFLAVLGLFAILPSAGWAQRVDSLTPSSSGSLKVRIAAVVNDNIVSTADLESRMRIAMLASGLPETPEVAHRLLPQILRSLIDEQLQMQEAKRLDITVPKEEIDQALERIAHDNNIPGGDMRAYVSSHGISPEALITQLRNALSWNKVIQRELRPRVEVGEDEVDAAIQRMRANAGKEEYLVSEIFLAVDNPQDEDQVKQFADDLVQKLKSGANFGGVARQFSQSTGAAQGGDIGWIQEGQLPPELNRVVTGMQPGEIGGPIRSANGFHIIGLREKRTITAGGDPGDITLELRQLFRSFDSAAGNKGAVAQESENLRTAINGCSSLQSRLERFPEWHEQDMGDVKLAKIPSWIASKVRDTESGKASEPIPTDKGALIFVVCAKHVPEGNADRTAIFNSIGTEKLELQSRRLLRDLHRDAYIDIRLPTTSS